MGRAGAADALEDLEPECTVTVDGGTLGSPSTCRCRRSRSSSCRPPDHRALPAGTAGVAWRSERRRARPAAGGPARHRAGERPPHPAVRRSRHRSPVLASRPGRRRPARRGRREAPTERRPRDPRRTWRRLLLGATLALLVAAALAGGFAWVAGGRIWSIGPWTILTLHVWAALAILPILVFHLLPRRWRLLRPSSMARPISRRTFLAVSGVVALGAVAWGAANRPIECWAACRRFTGSRWLPDGGVPPPTTFYGEGTPIVDLAAWRLRVIGRVATSLELDRASLAPSARSSATRRSTARRAGPCARAARRPPVPGPRGRRCRTGCRRTGCPIRYRVDGAAGARRPGRCAPRHARGRSRAAGGERGAAAFVAPRRRGLTGEAGRGDRGRLTTTSAPRHRSARRHRRSFVRARSRHPRRQIASAPTCRAGRGTRSSRGTARRRASRCPGSRR